MENSQNINTLMKETSATLLNSKYLLELMQSIMDEPNICEASKAILNKIILDNIISAFNSIETCRRMIAIDDY